MNSDKPKTPREELEASLTALLLGELPAEKAAALRELMAKDAELVKLKFNEGLSYKEMAKKTGLTVSHVGYLLHHAIKAVADELAKNGVGPVG